MSKLAYKSETSAGGIVRKTENGNVLWLVTQHSQHKGWGFPKGLIGDSVENESRESAAIREVREEGGVEAKILCPIPVEVKYTYRHKDILVDKTVYYFLMEYVSGDPADHDWEVSEAKFLDEDGVRNILTFDTDKEAFAGILALAKM
ncbi:MAG: NUDIX domain-containing protein [Patescibacteria group bacterium]|nr:NUDIX domain-containing protein [Patescibacteria group bacterium]